jgi:hypothetical protein
VSVRPLRVDAGDELDTHAIVGVTVIFVIGWGGQSSLLDSSGLRLVGLILFRMREGKKGTIHQRAANSYQFDGVDLAAVI